MHDLILLVIVAAVVLYARPRRENYHDRLRKLVARLPEGRMEPIMDYVREYSTEKANPAFWEVSGGLKGVRERLEALGPVLGVLQEFRVLGLVSTKNASLVWLYAVGQLWYSVTAYPEAWLVERIPDLPHTCALMAARLHWEITTRTLFLCQVEGAPNVIRHDRALL
jgi:hypothetical protein